MVFFIQDEQLQNLGNEVLEDVWSQFDSLAKNQIALTWVVYDYPVPVNTGGALTPDAFWKHSVRGFNYRGGERIYPASVVKLFYLVAVHEWLEKGMMNTSKELERALSDMIIDSSNDATSLIVDILSGTTSGPELPPAPFETWKHQRNIINRYYQSLGWEEMTNINVCQKTWGDGPYGRERVFYGEMFANRNMVTTNSLARLLHSIVGGVAVSSSRSQQMMSLLKRSINPDELPQDVEEDQVTGFLGGGLPENSQIWSKAGWTSSVRHDAAYIEIPEQCPYLLIVFTEGKAQAKSREILPFISQKTTEVMMNL
ncbi:MAG: serine hydrolase [Sphaerospermopsis sp. SIO1G2]|nr:serine hydrolase [Sphaerospermopsis sp. SIO1G2]